MPRWVRDSQPEVASCVRQVMTTQIPDTCMFDGRLWEIEDFSGDITCVPSNQQLGISTVSQHTANWGGRIDHFAVFNDRLYLPKIEVCLDDLSRQITENSRREVVLRYEPMLSCDKNGERAVIREYKFEYLLFNNLFVSYTGELVLKYPCDDIWNHPCVDEFDEMANNKKWAVLVFESGIMI